MSAPNIDLSRVPDLEKRRNSERLYLAMQEAKRARNEARDAALAKDAAFVSADTAYQVAREAYWGTDASEVPAVMTDEDDEIVRCALSGLPLLDDDEVLQDEETEEKILRSLLLPPRPEPQEDEEQDEEAEESSELSF